MSAHEKVPIGKTIKSLEMADEGQLSEIAKLKLWKDGDEDTKGAKDKLSRLYFYWKILWCVCGLAGVLFMALIPYIFDLIREVWYLSDFIETMESSK